MTGWFESKVACPVDEATREWIDRRWAWLEEQFGLERVRKLDVILPLAAFFPDEFSGNEEDARVLFDRVCRYMNIDAATVELFLYEDRNPVHDEQGRKGTAGLYQEEAGKFRVWVEASNLTEAIGMVATIAHELGHVYLLGHGYITDEIEDHEPLTDLLTVFLGMGIFTANSVIREHYWNAGAVSGWSIGRRGYMSMPMYGYALALFARARGETQPTWAEHLRPDVGSAFTAAQRFLAEAPVKASISALPTPIPAEEPPPDADDADNEDMDEAPLNAEVLLNRHAAGERDFRKAKLHGSQLRGADLRRCNLTGVDLTEADLTNANLAQANLRDADAPGAILRGADLRGAQLNEADFSGADLSEADLTGADIRGADFAGANLRQTILVGTIRNHRTNLSGEDLSEVICDADLSKEELHGASVLDLLGREPERPSPWISWVSMVVVETVAGLVLGGLAGMAVGAAFGIKRLDEFGACAGAILAVAYFFYRKSQKT